jgi:hypothetical protein
MMTLALLVGIWSSTCIQTQLNGRQGFVKEIYAFEEGGDYEFVREWYEDSGCKKLRESDSEVGTVVIGNRLSGMFISGNTFEADFRAVDGVDLGALSLSNNSLKIARGMKNSSMRNTMLGIFEFRKK